MRAAGCRINRGIDSNQPPLHVNLRATGIARIDRGIRLYEEAEIRNANAGPRQGRDNTAGHRLAKAKGIANGNHLVANLQQIGIAKRNERQVLPAPVDEQDCNVGALVGKEFPRRKHPPVDKCYGDIIRILHHMVVGDNDTGGR